MKKKNPKKKGLQKSVENTTVDVLKRLGHIKADDRYALLMEHMETLIYEWDAQEVGYLNYAEYCNDEKS